MNSSHFFIECTLFISTIDNRKFIVIKMTPVFFLSQIASLTAELQHATRAQQHYERMYRTLELKSRADTSRDQVRF